MLTEIEGKCQFPGCQRDATVLAVCDLKHKTFLNGIWAYCKEHALVVVQRPNPEYVVACPNCKCLFGVK